MQAGARLHTCLFGHDKHSGFQSKGKWEMAGVEGFKQDSDVR